MTEEFNKWLPVEYVKGDYLIRSIRSEDGKLKVSLSTNEVPSKFLLITFTDINLYRVTDESGRIRFWAKTSFEEPKWNFYVASASTLTDWLVDESDGIYANADMKHYLIKTQTEVLDVITGKSLPEVSWI